MLLENLHCLAHFAPRADNWVEQKHLEAGFALQQDQSSSYLSVCNVLNKFGKDHMCLVTVNVRVNEDFPNPHRPATILECFLHCFSGPERQWKKMFWTSTTTTCVWSQVTCLWTPHSCLFHTSSRDTGNPLVSSPQTPEKTILFRWTPSKSIEATW